MAFFPSASVSAVLVALLTLLGFCEWSSGEHIKRQQELSNSLLEANKLVAEIPEIVLKYELRIKNLEDQIGQLSTKVNGMTFLLGGEQLVK
jgi:TolA-binding protein